MGTASDPGALSPLSLEEIHATVPIPPTWWRRFLAFSGPAFLVSVGYMDPGNWGTDIEAGSRFGYSLLWVLLMSNLMAVLLQSLATRLGVVTGRDLAQACRESYPPRVVFALWILTEIAIAATDLAEVIGTIIALKLLFGLPYLFGLVVAAADTALLFMLQRRGVRLLEVVTVGLVAIIAGSFLVEIILCKPVWGEVVLGFLPGLVADQNGGVSASLYVAIAMLGATVMPHNLYLHSALVQTRAYMHDEAGKRIACKYNLLDSLLALNGAFFVNAAILIVAVASFHGRQEVQTLQDAHVMLHNVWGTALASVLFAVALLASGQSSTLTGTLAGQVVMEGFVHLRLQPWLRRLLTRSLALVPALIVIWLASIERNPDPAAAAKATDESLQGLLVFSQALLSFQLPFAIVPLVQFTGDRKWMGTFASGTILKVLSWSCALIVIGLNMILLVMQTNKWAESAVDAGWSAWWIYASIGPLGFGLLAFLGWMTVAPALARREEAARALAAPVLNEVAYRLIGVGVELEGRDNAVLAQAVALARTHSADLALIHVVEGIGAALYGAQTDAKESRHDREEMAKLVKYLQGEGVSARGVLGFGKPPEELVRITREHRLDLLVLGTHGHGFLADLALGHTVAPVLHQLAIPVLVVPNRPRDKPGV